MTSSKINLLRGFKRFRQGVDSFPLHWKIWSNLHVVLNLFAPLFFLPSAESIVTLVAIVLNTILLLVVVERTGFSRLIGLGHVVWLPLVPWIGSRLAQTEGAAMQAWMVALCVVNGLSLIIDAVDIVRYLRGDRADRAPESDASE